MTSFLGLPWTKRHMERNESKLQKGKAFIENDLPTRFWIFETFFLFVSFPHFPSVKEERGPRKQTTGRENVREWGVLLARGAWRLVYCRPHTSSLQENRPKVDPIDFASSLSCFDSMWTIMHSLHERPFHFMSLFARPSEMKCTGTVSQFLRKLWIFKFHDYEKISKLSLIIHCCLHVESGF